jgi:hypothetical protein
MRSASGSLQLGLTAAAAPRALRAADLSRLWRRAISAARSLPLMPVTAEPFRIVSQVLIKLFLRPSLARTLDKQASRLSSS